MEFKPYDPNGKVRQSRQDLPHWHQGGVTYFVTSRLADSMPSSAMKKWEAERSDWLRGNQITKVAELGKLPSEKQIEFHQTFTKRWHDFLDAGYGECVLKRREIAKIVIDQFKKGNGQRYHLDGWVLMPNHFHVLVRPIGSTDLSQVMKQWKGASARFANQSLGRSGAFWINEPYDHIVRSIDQLAHFRRYIANNPTSAGLMEDSYFMGMGSETISADSLFRENSRWG